ncbi:MAG: AEC family transporter [Acetobacteraceae bacterium]|nr:AEC family transporter [Acetobacteraceae bacterium]
MHAVLNAALPIFALILTGFLCGRFGVLSAAATDSLNRFAIYLALPALMFQAMSRISGAILLSHLLSVATGSILVAYLG